MNLFSAFQGVVAARPAEPAVFWGDLELSYETLGAAAARLSHHWAGSGLRPGDRVGLLVRNRPEFMMALMGILGAGGVVVPINCFLKAEEVAFLLEDSGAEVLVTEEALAEMVPQLLVARPGLRVLKVEEWEGLETEPVELPMREEGDLAVIIYTSGTTGKPKGAMLSHGNLLSNVESCREVLRAVDADRFVVVLPLFHSFTLCVGCFLPLLVGGAIVLVRSLHPPKNLLQEILRREGTILPAIPQFFRTLMNAPSCESLPLRVCISGGAPLPLEILREFNSKMPVRLLEGYGLSEASPVVSLNPIPGPWKDGSIGVPIPGVEVSVQDEQGRLLEVGAVGEICVRGGNVMLGYWNKPEATREVLRNGWLLTGDIGYGDADGYFYVTDRKKDMLLVNGINVYPREIEEVIYQVPGVKEAAVVGVPDVRRGEQPVAFVVRQEGAEVEEQAVQQAVRSKLADYKVPRRILFLDALPRNATGKVLKTALRHLALQQRGEVSVKT